MNVIPLKLIILTFNLNITNKAKLYALIKP